MKHSIVIGFIIKWTKKINFWYEHSYFHFILALIGQFFSTLIEGSLWGRGLKKHAEQKTLLTKIFESLFEFWNKRAIKTSRFFQPILEDSTLYRYVKNFETIDSTCLSMGFSLIICGFFSILFSFVSRKFSFTLSIVLFGFGFVLLLFSSGIINIIKRAKTYPLLKMCYELFTYRKEPRDEQTQEN